MRPASLLCWERLAAAASGLALVALAGSAHAGSAQDGEDGLAALNRGDYAEAVRLFTKALNAGDLNRDDRELAYLSRGRAYLAEGDRQDAVNDLRKAVSLNPDDVDAQDALNQSIASGVSGSDTSSADQSGAPWGLLANMAGHYYWYEVPGLDPHTAYITYGWATQGQVLSAIIRNRTGVAGAVEFVLNDDGHRLLMAGLYTTGAVFGTAASLGDSVREWSYANNVPIADTLKRETDGSVSIVESRFANGSWQLQNGVVRLIETSKAEIVAQGFKKVP